MMRRPPRSTLTEHTLSLHDALPISVVRRRGHGAGAGRRARLGDLAGGAGMKALTASRLADGEVVFWNKGQWIERFAEAELFDDPELDRKSTRLNSSH